MSLVYWPIPSSLDLRPILQPTPLHLKWVWLKFKGRQFSTLSHPVMSVALSFKDFACSVLRFIFSPASQTQSITVFVILKAIRQICVRLARLGLEFIVFCFKNSACSLTACAKATFCLLSSLLTLIAVTSVARKFYRCITHADLRHGKRWNPSTADTMI